MFAGFVERAVQELPPSGSRKQRDGAEVLSLLPLPGARQGCAAAAGPRRPRGAEGISGFHVADVARVHTKALQGRYEDTRRLLGVDAEQ